MNGAVNQQRHAGRLFGRSYVAFVFKPELPLQNWLADLDTGLERSPGFFVGRPVVLDLSAQPMGADEIAGLVAKLEERDIRVMGLEGADPAILGKNLPPLLKGGRAAGIVDMVQGAAEKKATAAAEPQAAAAPAPPSGSLVVEDHIRSGQSIVFQGGDVTILGSVGSGAEIVAAGSIHIYGTLRGRAMAGIGGNARARIFCRKIEAELLAIDGYYRTAEEISEGLRNRPVQAWLEGSTMMITALN
jgi:septum site-determining protein MinC